MKSADPTSSVPDRVLVAEDDERTRTALVTLLQRHGFGVTIVKDGQAAFNTLIAADSPQIALLDWHMPKLDGIQVCRAVRAVATHHYKYIVMVTARDSSEDMLAAFQAGVDDFLSKPVDSAQLLARLHCGKRVLALEQRCADRISDLERAVDEVRQLQHLLPICTYCKKVRDDGDYWHEIEAYIQERTGTEFSHGICPTCLEGVMGRHLTVTVAPKDHH